MLDHRRVVADAGVSLHDELAGARRRRGALAAVAEDRAAAWAGSPSSSSTRATRIASPARSEPASAPSPCPRSRSPKKRTSSHSTAPSPARPTRARRGSPGSESMVRRACSWARASSPTRTAAWAARRDMRARSTGDRASLQGQAVEEERAPRPVLALPGHLGQRLDAGVASGCQPRGRAYRARRPARNERACAGQSRPPPAAARPARSCARRACRCRPAGAR